MKKTRRTLLTAAAFAATLNMASVPNVNAVTEDELSAIGVQTPFDPASQEIQDVYGPAPDYNDPITSDFTETSTTITSTTAQTLYGPPVWFTTSDVETIVTETTTDFPPTVYGPPEMFYKKGDINGDNTIDVFDIIALRKKVINADNEEFNPFTDRAADVNGDGEINLADLVAMGRFISGKSDSFDPGWDITQPIYGPPITETVLPPTETTSYDINTTTSRKHHRTTTTTTTTTTGYLETFSTLDIGTMPIQPMYGPPYPDFPDLTGVNPFRTTTTTTNSTTKKPKSTTTTTTTSAIDTQDPITTVTDMPIQLMYGPPEYFGSK